MNEDELKLVVVDGCTPEGQQCLNEIASAIIAYARAIQKHAAACRVKMAKAQPAEMRAAGAQLIVRQIDK